MGILSSTAGKKLVATLAIMFLTGTSQVFLATTSQAQSLSSNFFAEALQQGGLVIVMRHASSPRELPDDSAVDPENTNGERQLDMKGKSDSLIMGEALRRLMIPVSEVIVSPTFRARETAKLMGFTVETTEELSNEGMRAMGEDKAAWLRQQVSRPAANGNRLLVTHYPNMAAAFPDYSEGIEDGEALIFAPNGAEEPIMIKRIKIEEWASL